MGNCVGGPEKVSDNTHDCSDKKPAKFQAGTEKNLRFSDSKLKKKAPHLIVVGPVQVTDRLG